MLELNTMAWMNPLEIIEIVRTIFIRILDLWVLQKYLDVAIGSLGTLFATLIGATIGATASIFATNKLISHNRKIEEQRASEKAEAEFKSMIEEIEILLIKTYQWFLEYSAEFVAPNIARSRSSEFTSLIREVNHAIFMARNRTDSPELRKKLFQIQGAIVWFQFRDGTRDERNLYWAKVVNAYGEVQSAVFGIPEYDLKTFLDAAKAGEDLPRL